MTIKIGIFGAGKLAHAIVEEVQASNVNEFLVVWMVDKGEMIPDSDIDVAIDASSADAVESHIDWAIRKEIPFVIATTGWDITDLAARIGEKTGVLVSPNFSFAVAFMQRIASQLARFADWYSDGEIAIFEHHHSAKKDSPSGTAKALVRAIVSSSTRYVGWSASGVENCVKDKIPIASLRAGTETGVHEILFDAPHEQFSMTHRARDRRVFAAGALKAAQWIIGRKGLFGMEDVLNDLFS